MAQPVDATDDNDHSAGVQRWWISALLISFTLLVAIVCIVLLASTLAQSRLTNLSIDGVQISIWKLDNAAQQWARLRRDLEKGNQQLAIAESKVSDLAQQQTLATADHRSTISDMEETLVGFYYKLIGLDVNLAQSINRQGYDDQISRIRAARDQLVAKYPYLGEIITVIDVKYTNYFSARQRLTTARTAISGNSEQIKNLKEIIAVMRTKLDGVYDLIKTKLDEPGRLRVENAFLELSIRDRSDADLRWITALRGAFSSLFYELVTFQPDLLTLLLVIIMGVLGSALQITHAYFIRNETEGAGQYFQRISVGALTALVIFIVAKAGIPVIAEPSRVTGDATINPYFISFLAILSGLLSENAISNVQAQGAKLFGPASAGTNRWSRSDLTEDFTDQKLSVGALAKYLGIDETFATSKLKGRAEVRPDEQDVIALYLRREPRDIFTDIPPR